MPEEYKGWKLRSIDPPTSAGIGWFVVYTKDDARMTISGLSLKSIAKKLEKVLS